MGLFDLKIAAGPLTLDAVVYQYQPDSTKGYLVRPDKAEMQRRQLVGVFRRLVLPAIYTRMRFIRARANSR